MDNELTTGICAPLSVASALVGFCENAMKAGEKFQDYYDKAVVKSEATTNARGGFFDLMDLKGRFVSKRAMRVSDWLPVNTVITALKKCSLKVTTTIALHQCRLGHSRFFDNRLDSWHDENVRAIPDFLPDLKVDAT